MHTLTMPTTILAPRISSPPTGKLAITMRPMGGEMIVNNATLVLVKVIVGATLAIAGGVLWAVTSSPEVGTAMLTGGLGLITGSTVSTTDAPDKE